MMGAPWPVWVLGILAFSLLFTLALGAVLSACGIWDAFEWAYPPAELEHEREDARVIPMPHQ